MAPLVKIVAALVRSSWRDLRSLGSIGGNNMLWVVVLIGPGSAFFLFVLGLLFLFPLSADVMRYLPTQRLQLWPLSRAQRVCIQLAALLLNPALLIGLAFASLFRSLRVGIELLIAVAVVQVLLAAIGTLLQHMPQWNLLHYIPRVPGRLGGLMQNQMRQLIGALDVWFAAVLVGSFWIYRFASAKTDPVLPMIIGAMVVVFLSTLAQCQLGFDTKGEMDRYRLMPLSGIELLLAKDMAWMVFVIVLTLPLEVSPSLAAAFTALAIGHRTATQGVVEQRRWRFSSGRIYPAGLVQIVGIALSATTVHEYGWVAIAPFAGLYAASLWWFGRRLHAPR